MMPEDFIFRQLFDSESCTYTYLIADGASGQAVIIDPVIQKVDRDLQLVADLGLTLIYAANTHVHADHITGSGKMKTRLPGLKSVLSEASGGDADLFLNHGDVLNVGSFEIEVRATPGHTNGCVTYVVHQQRLALTGDALLVRGCGRTDFQQGNSARLYQSVHEQIFSLPDDFKLFPAHDYKGFTVTTVKEEKTLNPRLSKSEEEFVAIMAGLNLPYPKMIDAALPANLKCGLQNLPEELEFDE
ncbi:unnamed protein product [Notodromas monacha]|uniref:Persulfide dioxygenase ETHE1, mitochondrial n=1 Tax=Notodromas monacha TaxID=399045 RepID=A0A7R9BDA9_9CRUS|nr:unnamed protein product [Notodromas monacha]CAG0912658.1 unnamed protein product [Notodromas monacha]